MGLCLQLRWSLQNACKGAAYIGVHHRQGKACVVVTYLNTTVSIGRKAWRSDAASTTELHAAETGVPDTAYDSAQVRHETNNIVRTTTTDAATQARTETSNHTACPTAGKSSCQIPSILLGFLPFY